MGGDFVSVRPMTAREIENVTLEIRSAFGISTKNVHMIQLVEVVLPLILNDYDFWVLPDEEMPDMAGLATYGGERTIYLSDSTYESLAKDDPEARHTAAHEFGHMVLHSHQTPVMAKRITNDLRFDPEWQADRFADYWLMPTEGVRKCRSANHVAAKYNVSIELAARRFDEVKNQGIQGELF